MSYAPKQNNRDYSNRPSSAAMKNINGRSNMQHSNNNSGENYYENRNSNMNKTNIDAYGNNPQTNVNREHHFTNKSNNNKSRYYPKNLPDKYHYYSQRPPSPQETFAIPEIDHLRQFIRERAEVFRQEMKEYNQQTNYCGNPKSSPTSPVGTESSAFIKAPNHQYNKQNSYSGCVTNNTSNQGNNTRHELMNGTTKSSSVTNNNYYGSNNKSYMNSGTTLKSNYNSTSSQNNSHVNGRSGFVGNGSVGHENTENVKMSTIITSGGGNINKMNQHFTANTNARHDCKKGISRQQSIGSTVGIKPYSMAPPVVTGGGSANFCNNNGHSHVQPQIRHNNATPISRNGSIKLSPTQSNQQHQSSNQPERAIVSVANQRHSSSTSSSSHYSETSSDIIHQPNNSNNNIGYSSSSCSSTSSTQHNNTSNTNNITRNTNSVNSPHPQQHEQFFTPPDPPASPVSTSSRSSPKSLRK